MFLPTNARAEMKTTMSRLHAFVSRMNVEDHKEPEQRQSAK
jgi:hypothetical protein